MTILIVFLAYIFFGLVWFYSNLEESQLFCSIVHRCDLWDRMEDLEDELAKAGFDDKDYMTLPRLLFFPIDLIGKSIILILMKTSN